MTLADEQRAAGEHAAAARSYAAAYRVLPPEHRTGKMGEVVLDNALADFAKAATEHPEDLRLREEPTTLLYEYLTIRRAAHEAGRADPPPPRLEREVARLDADLADARAKTRPPPLPPPPPVDLTPALDHQVSNDSTTDIDDRMRVTLDHTARHRRLVIGSGVSFGAGAILTATAITFGALHNKPFRVGTACQFADSEGDCPRLWDTTHIWTSTLTAGVVSLGVGTALLLLANKRRANTYASRPRWRRFSAAGRG